MDQRNESGLPASLLNGRLEGLSVPDLLWKLCGRHSTGVLHLVSRDITKKIYIESGRIVFALSGDADDRLGNLLLREGLITLDQLEGAVVHLAGGKRLGTILVEAGHLTPDNLVRGVVSQVKSVVLGLFPLEEGEYAFVEGPLPTEEVVTLGMRTASILLEGIRQIRSFTRIRKSVGPLSTRFRLDPAWHTVLDGLDIRDGERMLLQRLDEAGAAGMPLDALCREVFLSNFEIYQALWAFMVLGVVCEADRTQDPAPGSALVGRVERAALPEILVRLCRGEVTGVLHMSRGTLERSLHVKNGQCVFATSNNVDDGLVAHLLRRGVISLSDREETARRLLSNKRVGTILLEMGVIDEDDLRATVREQLSEIVFDTFRWDQGDFQFLEGPLPTVEDITLTRSVEDLVFAGVRRVTSWPRVREGCGGLNARLVLLPEYLAVLDKTTVGPEEWELISLLKSPKTLLEICRESMLGDFRSCQILWALRLLGGVGEAALDVSVDSALGLFDATPVVEPEPVAATPELDPEPEPEPVAATPEPEPDPEPIPLSEADESAEVISEPWRLAAERRPEPVEAAQEPAKAVEPEPIEAEHEEVKEPAPAPPRLQLDSPSDATIYIPREDVEAALRGPDEGPPRFELGEPGIGIEDMNVDMRPDAPRTVAFQVPGAGSVEAVAPPEPVSRDTEDQHEASDPDRTARVSREELEAALEPPAPAARIDLPPFEPPPDLDGAIASFNARHVVLFRALRAEVGAGAANFVRSCRATLDNGFPEMFESAGLRADGSWDPEALKKSVIDHRTANASEGFSKLLDAELQKLRAHLGDARTAALADQLHVIR